MLIINVIDLLEQEANFNFFFIIKMTSMIIMNIWRSLDVKQLIVAVYI